jgi:beta-phosphoglucomutase-like phosphatase (HAD superfamily)
MDALDAITVPICVASSSFPEKLRLGLEVVGLYERFEPNVISASVLACGKPEPDVFIYAAGWMHKAPAQCVVVEDSVPGVKSARRAGMRVLGFDGGRHCTPNLRGRLLEAGAELVFSDMRQLPALVSPSEEQIDESAPALTASR